MKHREELLRKEVQPPPPPPPRGPQPSALSLRLSHHRALYLSSLPIFSHHLPRWAILQRRTFFSVTSPRH